jgi:hypothetical protein
MKKPLAWLVAMLTAATPAVGEIPLFSEALARERGPTEAPFTVTYRSDGKVLAFVGADHVFTNENSTIDSIRRAWADANPSVVIIEGFPTALGRSPEPILQSVRRRDSPEADAYSKSEAIFAASEALARNVPFIGGEPTMIEEIDGLVARGYRRDDVLFAFRVRSLGQARRSGEMPAGNAAAFKAGYEREAGAIARMTATEAIAEARFIAEYLRIVGVDPISDVDMPARSNPGTDTLLQRIAADNMRFRDEHLLSTILRELAVNKSVLVVYGNSHWTTLSPALEDRLGKPVIRCGDDASRVPFC